MDCAGPDFDLRVDRTEYTGTDGDGVLSNLILGSRSSKASLGVGDLNVNKSVSLAKLSEQQSCKERQGTCKSNMHESKNCPTQSDDTILLEKLDSNNGIKPTAQKTENISTARGYCDPIRSNKSRNIFPAAAIALGFFYVIVTSLLAIKLMCVQRHVDDQEERLHQIELRSPQSVPREYHGQEEVRSFNLYLLHSVPLY